MPTVFYDYIFELLQFNAAKRVSSTMIEGYYRNQKEEKFHFLKNFVSIFLHKY